HSIWCRGDVQHWQVGHDICEIPPLADAAVIEGWYAVDYLIVHAFDAIVEEEPLFAPEWRREVVQDTQQLLDPLLILAHGCRYSREPERPLRVASYSFSTARPGGVQPDQLGSRLRLAELVVGSPCQSRAVEV